MGLRWRPSANTGSVDLAPLTGRVAALEGPAVYIAAVAEVTPGTTPTPTAADFATPAAGRRGLLNFTARSSVAAAWPSAESKTPILRVNGSVFSRTNLTFGATPLSIDGVDHDWVAARAFNPSSVRAPGVLVELDFV